MSNGNVAIVADPNNRGSGRELGRMAQETCLFFPDETKGNVGVERDAAEVWPAACYEDALPAVIGGAQPRQLHGGVGA
jgi:hypothetical protein